MSSALFRLGRLAFLRRRFVVGIWAAVLTLCLALALGLGGQINNEFVVPGTDSQRATDLLSNTFPEASGASAQIVFEAEEDERLDNTSNRTVVERIISEARRAPAVEAVTDPFVAGAVSPDGRIAFAQVQYEVGPGEVEPSALDALQETRSLAGESGVTVEFGGEAFTSNPAVGATELLGVIIAFVVLTAALRSFFVAGLPLIASLFGLGVSMSIVFAFSDIVALSSAAPLLAVMIGLAVGIDYSLFIISRYRNELHSGSEKVTACARAVATSGSAVVFAGITVVVALVALAIVQVPFLTVMGLSAAVTVVVAVAVAITLLPAMLGFAGTLVKPIAPKAAHSNRWLKLILRKPAITVAVVALVLLAAAVPARDLYLALPDNGSAPEESTQRKAYDTIATGFGPGFNGPLVVVIDQRNGAGQGAEVRVAEDLRVVDNIVVVAPPQPGDGVTVLQAVPAFAPDDARTREIVSDVRALEDRWRAATGANTYVTGYTAAGIDVSDRLTETIIPFLLVVVGLALLVLLVVFRSIVVPIKATLGFLLSVGAAFGATVAVFQWGWLADLFSVTPSNATANFLPVILMAVLFGLAMDYQVFLVSRMREAFVSGTKAHDAIRLGFSLNARVVTAAALIMFSVFASFVGNEDVSVAAIAFGLAVGVLIDAFLVRMTLVPAAMSLLGDRAWWLPAAIEKRLPRIDIEGDDKGSEEVGNKQDELQHDETQGESVVEVSTPSPAQIERRALQRALRDFQISPSQMHVKVSAYGDEAVVSMRGPVELTVVHGVHENEEELTWRFAKRLATTPGTVQPKCADHDHPLIPTLSATGATWSCPEAGSGQGSVGSYLIDLRARD